ncbi:response regulator [Pseudobacteriovorax antillogorgiicola]|uniref:Response regulator receiver domain-containing protein n=1 Tax=Pseudobacteriovorax antillogorgiicola TaxID=1513793 RepID=A0A1Y6CKX7_9BACT|nr:response regulator [Pseudobacteriovorax antillogorgiicola]TCS45650.1 response regulator receiver domain-containing protein [Pseudobacteriovorax antillogorgiicola]SMF72873.1 Response regulator receiver domain-containing protein [Pseudobacteriovorax antillogorgiicola]
MTIQDRTYNRTSHILVVDDDDTLLKFFKIHLNKFFSRVIVVKNAKEAIETLKDKEIDLVISDIKMPRMDGIQLMKKVKNHDPSIPVFLVSGALLNETQQTAIDTKADGYLKKPFGIDELHDFIDRGIQVRDAYKELLDIIQDKKKFLELIQGKRQLRFIKDEEQRSRAQEIMDHLKAS